MWSPACCIASVNNLAESPTAERYPIMGTVALFLVLTMLGVYVL